MNTTIPTSNIIFVNVFYLLVIPKTYLGQRLKSNSMVLRSSSATDGQVKSYTHRRVNNHITVYILIIDAMERQVLKCVIVEHWLGKCG